MSSFSLDAVQQALYTSFTGDTLLNDIIQGHVYDHIPDHGSYPCVVIGEGKQQDIATDAALASRMELRLYCYSKGQGRKEVLSILHRLHTLLHHGSISITGGTVVHMRVDDVETRIHPDGQMAEGVMRVILLIDHAGGA